MFDPKTIQELENEFKVEINSCWLDLYKDKLFIEQMLRKVFYYYDKATNRPKDRDGWARAINSFCRNNLIVKKTTTNYSSMMPRLEPPKYATEKSECLFCDDLGVVWVHALDGSYETLMQCDCIENPAGPDRWRLPQWDSGLGPILRKERCPLEWFKPTVFNGQSEQIWDKAKNWRERVKKAEAWWEKERQAIEMSEQ